jgi:hypothetical protein
MATSRRSPRIARCAKRAQLNTTKVAVNAFMGGVASFERELVDGMNESLARIKAAAES